MNSPTNPIIPNQADRDRAGDIHHTYNGEETMAEAAIRAGQDDDHWLVQEIASHRIASLEEAAKVVERYEHQIAPFNDLDERRVNEVAEVLQADISEAIRTLKGTTPVEGDTK